MKPYKAVGRSRIRALSAADQQSLVEACNGEFKPLVIGALATGARYSELARCKVKDFHQKAKTLFIEVSKSEKSRHIRLTDDAVAWFTEYLKGRGPEEVLFPRTDVKRATRMGNGWMNHDQVPFMAAACKAASLTLLSFHELRHTYTSGLVNAGMPLIYVAAQVGHSDMSHRQRIIQCIAVLSFSHPLLQAQVKTQHELHFGIYYRETLRDLKTKFPEDSIKPFKSRYQKGRKDFSLHGRSFPGLVVLQLWSRRDWMNDLAKKNPKLKSYPVFKSALAKANSAPKDQDLEVWTMSWIPSDYINLSTLVDKYGPYNGKERSDTYVPVRTWNKGIAAFLAESKRPESEWKVEKIDYQYLPDPKETLEDPVDELISTLIAKGEIPKLD